MTVSKEQNHEEVELRSFLPNTTPEYATEAGSDRSSNLIIDNPRSTDSAQGAAYCGDSLELLEKTEQEVDLIVTSPPFALRKKKEYGNHAPSEYNDWFIDFASKAWNVLGDTGDLVIDIGGGWEKGEPIRSTYHFELLVDLTTDGGKLHSRFGKRYNLAQDFYWYNPAKLPTPAQWVTIERSRVKDAVNHVWWLSKDNARDRVESQPDNRDVLKPYSDAQKRLMQQGYQNGERPSGHNISDRFDQPEEDGAIRPNFWNVIEDSLYPWDVHDILDIAGVSKSLRKAAEESGQLYELAEIALDEEILEHASGIENSTESRKSQVLEIANTRSKTRYLHGCDVHDIDPHPARFPRELPEFFINFLTEPGDLVMDIFAGSNITGWIAQKNHRNWIAFEKSERYIKSSEFWFKTKDQINNMVI